MCSNAQLPELRVRVHEAEPIIRQLVEVDPIRKLAPFQTVITLHPVLIWSLPENMWRHAAVKQGK